MRQRKVLSNYIFTVLYRIIAALSTVVTVPHVSRALGNEAIGVYTYTSTISSYCILLCLLGSKTFAYREIAYCQNNRGERSKIVWRTLRIRLITFLLTIFVFFIICLKSEYRNIQLIWIIELAGNFLDIEWFYNGIENFKSSMLRNIAAKIISVILILLFVNVRDDLSLYVLIQTGCIFFGNLWLWFKMPKYIDGPSRDGNYMKLYVTQILILAIPQVIESVYMMLDKIMLKHLSTIVEVGYYGQAERIITIMVSIVNSVNIVYGPRMVAKIAEGNKEDISSLLTTAFYYMCLVSLPIVFGLSSISEILIPWFFGDDFLPVGAILKIYSFVILLTGISSNIGWLFLLSAKRDKQFTYMSIIGAAFDFFLNVLLIPRFKALGAVIATLFSYTSMIAVGYMFSKDVLKIKDITIKTIKPLISAVIMYIIIFVLRQFIPSELKYIIGIVCLGALIYGGMLILLRDEIVLTHVRYCINKALMMVERGKSNDSK